MNQHSPTRPAVKDLVLFVALLLATLALITDGATATRADVGATKPSAAVEPAQVDAVELPREWRWEREAVTFDHMYRERR